MTTRTVVGYVASIEGAEATVLLDAGAYDRVGLGDMLLMATPASMVFGLVRSLATPAPSATVEASDRRLALVALFGESLGPDRPDFTFQRGVSVSPRLGAPVALATSDDLTRIYAKPTKSSVVVGSLHQDPSVPAYVVVDDLLGKHFAVLGPPARASRAPRPCFCSRAFGPPQRPIVLLDPHDEYAAAFGDQAENDTPEQPHPAVLAARLRRDVAGDCSTEARTARWKPKTQGMRDEAKLENCAGPGPRRGRLTIDTPTPIPPGPWWNCSRTAWASLTSGKLPALFAA
jgi:hypothetical protein